MRRIAALALLCAASAASAQSLAQRVAGTDGSVQVIYPSRPSACGDGRNYINNIFGGSSSANRSWDACVHGPARALVTVISGEVTRVRAFVGPVPSSDIRTIAVSAQEASTWLSSLISNTSSRVASEAMTALVLADGTDPWPQLLRVARDDSRTLAIRRSALTWLGNGVNEKLGLADERANTDDDEIREQAVFALSQRPKGESVPELIDLARNAKYPSARRSAIFWLGQTGDMRAAEVFAELLKLR